MFNRFKRRRSSFNIVNVTPRRRFFRRPEISKTKITVGLLIIFALLVGYMIFFSNLFKLRLVEFETQTVSCVETSAIARVVPKNENILFVQVDNLADTIKAKYPCLEYVSLRKKFPETLVVSMSERKMVAVIKAGVKQSEVIVEVPEATASSASARPVIPPRDDFKVDESEFSKFFAVDKEGFVLAENPTPEEQLPLFYYLSEQPVEVNHYLPKGLIMNALTLSAKLWEMGIEVQTQKIIGTSFYIDGPQRIIFLLEKDPTEQVIPLQLILQKAKIDSTPIEKIDLRFDKPVVVYGKKPVTGTRN